MRRNGKETPCATCGQPIYVTPSMMRLCTQGGPYCSRGCKHKAMKGRPQRWHDPTHKVRHSGGYILVWMPEHPRAVRGRVLEHVVVIERKLGRLLDPKERVHHIDGDRTNNSPDNLRLMADDAEHSRLHAEMRRQSGQSRLIVPLTCQECGKGYGHPPAKAKTSKYCSGTCRSRAVSRKRWQAQRGV